MSKKLLRSTLTVGGFTLLSRILGLVREVVFATTFGATAGMDAFLVAFKLPNFMRRLFAEGAFSQAFVPVLSEYKSQAEKDELREFVRSVFGTLALIVFVVALIGSLLSAVWVAIFAPGFLHQPHKFDLATQMLRITFPYLFFISLTAFAGGVLNTFKKFAVPAFMPIVLNVVLILAALFLAPHLQTPIKALAWGILIAGVVQFVLMLPFLAKLGVLRWPKIAWHHAGVRKLIRLMVPALFGASVAQLSLLIDTIFASFLKTGSISWLYYSDRLMQFPLGVFGVALATVVLPHFSEQHVQKDTKAFNQSLDWALRWVVMIAIPAAVALMLLSGPLLVTLFQYHAFNHYDVLMSQESLIAYSVGLCFFIWVKVLVSAYYSRQDMKTPVKIAVVALTVNVVFNALLFVPLAHAGLALATSISAIVNGCLLYWGLRKSGIHRPLSGWGRVWLGTLVATALMVAFLWYFSGSLSQWFAWHAWARCWHLLLLVVVALLLYAGCLRLLIRVPLTVNKQI